MNFYIEETGFKVIVYAGKNPYLINNLCSGVLNCRVLHCESIGYESIVNHMKFNLPKNGSYFGHNSLECLPLSEHPRIQNLIKVLNLRAPAFDKLLEHYNQAMISNLWGFGDLDVIAVKQSLTDKLAMSEYAAIMRQDADFATSELSLIVDSIIDDRFRIFSVCSMWKEKINNCFTQEEIDRLMLPMKHSFKASGIRNDV